MTVHPPPASTPTAEQVVQGSDGSAPAPGQEPPSLAKPGQEVSLTGSLATQQPGAYKEPAPKPGVPILPAVWPPKPGQVIVDWEGPEPGCCKCEGLSCQGWVSVVILAVLITPLCAWIPCCIGDCFEQYQRPVYGWPKDRSSGVADTTAPAQQRIE